MGQIERLLAALTILLVFAYVVLRAIYVPTFHDEAATFFHYIVSEKFLPYQAHWDANNHILNSAFSYFCYKVFGAEQWSIRLPNVLSFLIYGFFSFKIAGQISRKSIRWFLFIALLTTTFLIEFFSLARGYAMSIAFMMAAVYYVAQYFRIGSIKSQLLVWFWMCLSVGASLTLLNSYLIILGLVFLVAIQHENRAKHLLVWLFVGGFIFAAAAFYAFELKERGLLYTGRAEGFIVVTVRSLVRYQLGVESQPVSILLTMIGAVSALYLTVKTLSKSLAWNTVSIASVLLLLNAVGSVLLNLIFGMNFPENRVGMYFLPLFLITIAGAIDGLSFKTKNVQWVAALFLFFPVHLLAHRNLDTTILWPKWHASDAIYKEVVELEEERNETLMISAEYLNELGWAYYNFQNNSALQLLQRDPVPDTLADLIIARPADFDFESVPYKSIYHDKANDVFLLERIEKLIWNEKIERQESRLSFIGNDEFYEIINTPVSDLESLTGFWELTGTFDATKSGYNGQLIITTEASEGGEVYYNMIPLHWIRSSWSDDTLHIKRTFHFPPETISFKIYFWNIPRDNISFSGFDLRFGTLQQKELLNEE